MLSCNLRNALNPFALIFWKVEPTFDNTPVTFALELIKTRSPHIILSDIKLVHMDEYLDLLNLGLKKNKKKL